MDVPGQHIFFTLLCGAMILAFTLELVRRTKLQESYALLWIVLAVAFMSYGWWIAPMAALANWLRIADVVPMVLFFGIFLCALLILQLCVKSTEFSNRIKNLTQELSILKHELERTIPRTQESATRADQKNPPIGRQTKDAN